MRGQSCIRAVARRQNWLITFTQLRALGFSRSAIDRMVRAERLFRVHRGVYLVGRPELLQESSFHAAVLAIGDDAGLAGFAAAALWGLWKGATDPIEVVVPRRLPSRDGICVHGMKDMPLLTERHGIPVTTAEFTILFLAGTMYSDRHFRRLVHEAFVQELTSLSALLGEVARTPQRTRAVIRVERELADGAKPTRSGLEDELVELLRRHDFPPFGTSAYVPGTPRWVEVDVYFGEQRLAVEIDGDKYHSTSYRREFDSYKDGVVRRAGVEVLRLGEEAVTPARESRTVAQIRGALARST
jgi:very-short-patch-repair endonuclease